VAVGGFLNAPSEKLARGQPSALHAAACPSPVNKRGPDIVRCLYLVRGSSHYCAVQLYKIAIRLGLLAPHISRWRLSLLYAERLCADLRPVPMLQLLQTTRE
jgi:hypothetical protein